MVRLHFVLVFFFLGSLTLDAASTFNENPSTPWGMDSDLTVQTSDPIPAESFSFPSKTCQSMIKFFQNYISPIDGPRSHFYPTSSQYALQAIQKYGVLKGIALGCDRLMRENKEDWVYPVTSKHGMDRKYDPVR